MGSTFLALLLVDKWGRRPLLLLGTFGMLFCLGNCVHMCLQRPQPDGLLQARRR